MTPWFAAESLDREILNPLIADVIDRVVTARDADRMPHALMFVGPPGLGRELAAVETAAALTCSEKEVAGCQCGSCDRVRRGSHPDVLLIQGEGKADRIRIEQIRQIVKDVPSRPFEGAARVWIFDGVEAARLGAEAANAFLKTLEEPPGHVRFILLAANPDAVLSTIRSRCQTLSLPGMFSATEMLAQAGSTHPALSQEGGLGVLGAESRDTIVRALDSAFDGDLLPLFRAAHQVGTSAEGLDAAAAAVAELAADHGGERGDRLSRLADDLLRAARSTRSLNLNPQRQLLAALLRWSADEEAVR